MQPALYDPATPALGIKPTERSRNRHQKDRNENALAALSIIPSLLSSRYNRNVLGVRGHRVPERPTQKAACLGSGRRLVSKGNEAGSPRKATGYRINSEVGVVLIGAS